jgi:hypothetical protein
MWPEEKRRIKNLGGTITHYPKGDDPRIKGLSVSRAFGDFNAEPYLTNMPDIFRYKLDKNDKFIVFACDGLWEVLQNQDVVNFILNESAEMSCSIENLKMQSYVYTSNMVLFNEKNQLKKYKNVDNIIVNFCTVRLEYYVKRKAYQINNIENEIRHFGNKQRFIQEVIDDVLIIMKVKEEEIVNNLKKRGYDEEPNVGGYDYLLRLQVRTFTIEKVNQIKNDIKMGKTRLNILKKTKPEDIWLSELDEFKKEYDNWMIDMSKRAPKK